MRMFHSSMEKKKKVKKKRKELPVSIWVNTFMWLRKLILSLVNTIFQELLFPKSASAIRCGITLTLRVAVHIE